VNALGPLDLLEVAVSGLKPDHLYTLWLVDSKAAPSGQREALSTFRTNVSGAQITQAIAPLRQVLMDQRKSEVEAGKERFLLLTDPDTDHPELVQGEITP